MTGGLPSTVQQPSAPARGEAPLQCVRAEHRPKFT